MSHEADTAPEGCFLALLQAAQHRPAEVAPRSRAYHPYGDPANQQKPVTGGKGKGKGKVTTAQADTQKAVEVTLQHSPLRYLKQRVMQVMRTPTRPTRGTEQRSPVNCNEDAMCSPPRNTVHVSPGNTPTQRTGAQRNKVAPGAVPTRREHPPEGAPIAPMVQDDDNSDEGAAADVQSEDGLDSQLRTQLQEQGTVPFVTGDRVQGLWDTNEWLDATIVAHATTHNTYTIKWDIDKTVTSGYGTQDGRLRPHPAGRKAKAPGNGMGREGAVRKRAAPSNAA